ncbi:MAG: hypothetical protein V7K48_00915 [Nostoc sp.]|uniref:hypothetical protein n=1 Tax=Nostoc sp. TaxID=1180 RepID=UPI002FFCE1F4
MLQHHYYIYGRTINSFSRNCTTSALLKIRPPLTEVVLPEQYFRLPLEPLLAASIASDAHPPTQTPQLCETVL